MRCDAARRMLSDRLDAPLDLTKDERVETHVGQCAACRSFERQLQAARRHLHLQPVGGVPDVAPRVRAVLEARPDVARPGHPSPDHPNPSRTPAAASRWRGSAVPAVAASFVAAFVLAASFVGLTGPLDAEATDIASLVLTGQTELRSLTATVEVDEYGWHPDVPHRRYAGSLAYRAPESLALELQDVTDYPSDDWGPNDVSMVVDRDRAWGSGVPRCPAAALPECLPEQPRTRVVIGREPFDHAEPVPLDLVLPVASFVVAGAERPLGEAQQDGRDAIGVQVTAAQIAPLLEGVERHGNWRPIHPTDEAAVWLDAELGVPLLVEVRVNAGFERDRWAAANGLDESDGDPVLSLRLRDVRINEDANVTLPPPPGIPADHDRGFRDAADADTGGAANTHTGGAIDGEGGDGELVEPSPSWLPSGMTPHRQGRIGDTTVLSYSDGRAWVTVRSTTSWRGGRLFGQPASVVRRIVLDPAGTAYLADGGDRILIHGDGVDVEVVGSLPFDELARVAASLGVRGMRVPAWWAEAATATLGDATAAWPGLLTLPDTPEGYAGPAVAMSDLGVVQSFVGSGERAFVISQTPGGTLGPPLDAVVVAVEVREREARYTPDRGRLEWVEDGRVVTVSGRALGLPELVTIADALEAAS